MGWSTEALERTSLASIWIGSGCTRIVGCTLRSISLGSWLPPSKDWSLCWIFTATLRSSAALSTPVGSRILSLKNTSRTWCSPPQHSCSEIVLTASPWIRQQLHAQPYSIQEYPTSIRCKRHSMGGVLKTKPIVFPKRSLMSLPMHF